MQLEGKVDQDKAEILKQLQAEVQQLQHTSRSELNESAERIMNIVN